MQPPNINNLFVPGGVVFFFDPGTGERDIGLIEDPPDVESKATEIKVYSNRSGKRRLAKIFTTEEEVNWSFKLQEAVSLNMQAFFKGAALEAINPGTGSVVDQVVPLNGPVFSSVGEYGISAVTVRSFLDFCLRYIAASGTWIDNSALADQAAGNAFDLLDAAADALYLGKVTPFQTVHINLAVPGAYTGLAVDYWNGSAWVPVTGLGGAADGLAASGVMTFTLPSSWQQCFVNGIWGYFLKITATGVTTAATATNLRGNFAQGTDYLVDPGQISPGYLVGRIAGVAGGGIAVGESVKASFTYTTWSSLRFAVANDEYQQGAARIQFRPLKGFQWNYIIPRCQIKPNGKMTIDDKKVLEVPMTMEVLDNSIMVPGTPYPFGYWECINES